nr:pentatricopeptide repeat-containing protein [Tanacetum cinerariifolium]
MPRATVGDTSLTRSYIPKVSQTPVLIIPFTGQALFTNEWDLGSLAYSQETEGPYHTNLPTPEEIYQFLQFQRVDPNRAIKNKNVILSPNQVLTKELTQDLKRWNEIIYEKVFGLGGYWEHLPTCLAHILYCILAEQQYNIVYFFVKIIKSARATPKAHIPYGMFLTRLFQHVTEHYPHLDNGIYNVVECVMRPFALKQTRRPLSDRGKACHSVSSTSVITVDLHLTKKIMMRMMVLLVLVPHLLLLT